MEFTEMSIPDAYRVRITNFPDKRGTFYEAWRFSELLRQTGHSFEIRQVNYSISKKNTLRGIHSTTIPPGQTKLVTCVRGAAWDVAVDLRIGSPTFGQFDATLQEGGSGIGVYLADGIGHAFLALTDDTCMNYLCGAEYVPGTMIDVLALDPALGIPWELDGPPIMSDKDSAAPALAEAVELGLLPTYEQALTTRDQQLSSGDHRVPRVH
jgi:NDP-hexose 3,5-(Or5-) epimerase